MKLNQQNYLVIDLEATCWATHDESVYPNEIIEIGIVILSPLKEELWRGGWFVRPTLSPILSDFCLRLTTIKQTQVDEAPCFPEVMDAFCAKVEDITNVRVEQAIFVSWGNYDRRQFEKDCTLHGYSYPFGQHQNLKLDIMRQYNIKKVSLDAAMKLLDLPFIGTPHRGVDDAINISRIFQRLQTSY